jgi:iron complex transport system substrate-binding protein
LDKGVMKDSSSIIIFAIIMGFSLSLSMPASARSLIDQLGRRIEVPDEPKRVVALAPSITEIIFAIEREDRLKGVTIYSDFPPAAAELPRVGSYVQLDLERIVALKPDLCIAIKDGNPKATVERLEHLKIPVYAVNPKDIKTVMQTILDLGKLLNAEESANSLVENMRGRIDKVTSLVENVAHRPRVFFQIGIAPIVSIGTDTFIHELIVLAGGKNVAAGSVAYPRFSREQVLALAPEVFIITSMARVATFEQVKTEWSRWPNMPAVRDQRIFLVDSNLFDRPTPRLVDALEVLVKKIHPELFEEKE